MWKGFALALVFAAASVSAGDAAQPRLPGRIVFASERGSTLENSRLFAVRVTGVRRRVLSRIAVGGDSDPAWSPDGSRIAFLSQRVERGRTIQALYVMRADGRGERRLSPQWLDVTSDFGSPDWSPRGTTLVFTGSRGESPPGLWMVRLHDKRLRLLATGGYDADWSPRGNRIAFVRRGAIWTVPAVGGRARRVTRGPNDGSASWSPDGRAIAFVRSDANGSVQSLNLVAAAGGRVRRVFAGRDIDLGRAPSWSRSGRAIAFSTNLGIYVARIGGRVARVRRGADWPAWSPDGRRLAFVQASAVYVMNADGRRARRVRSEPRRDFTHGPVWSADGRTLVYSTAPARSDIEIFSVRADGSHLTQLTRNSVQDWSPEWSLDRRRIAFESRGFVWVMNADGSAKRRLFGGRQPSWSPNGGELAYVADGVVHVRSLSGGAPTLLATGSSPAWSPRGSEIAFVRGTSLMVVDVATRAERTIATVGEACVGSFDSWFEEPDWSPDGTRLVTAIVCDDGTSAAVSPEIVAADGSVRQPLSADAAPTGLAWSPDGTRIAFVSETDSPLQTVRVDGTGRRIVLRDVGGAAYTDPDW